jgi:hypothetical protein
MSRLWMDERLLFGGLKAESKDVAECEKKEKLLCRRVAKAVSGNLYRATVLAGTWRMHYAVHFWLSQYMLQLPLPTRLQ